MRRMMTIFLSVLAAAPAGLACAGDVDLLSYDRGPRMAAPGAAPVNLQPPRRELQPALRPVAKKAVSAKPKPALLKSQDRLHIVVENEPELSGSYTIGRDGAVALPLIGKMRASGRTLRDLQAALVAKYKDGYLIDPAIRVTRGAGP